MQIRGVKIKNFRGIEEGIFYFDKFNILIGDNGTSKTTILEALNYCLSPSFVSSRIKYSDFYQGEDRQIEIQVVFDECLNVGLLDGYNTQQVSCKGVVLKIKKRDSSRGITKAFADGFVITHYLVPNAQQISTNPNKWYISRQTGTQFQFTERHLAEALRELPYRTFYFDKNRDRQLQRGFNSSITSVYDDFNWRFIKNTRGAEAQPLFDNIDTIEQSIINAVDAQAMEKSLKDLNTKLRDIIGDEIAISLLDRFEPFNNASLIKTVGDIKLATAQLGSGIEMIVSLMFLETMASLSKESFTILIDEPEIHLHPSLQLKLVKYLKGLSQNHQVIISTHSPFIFKSVSPQEGKMIPRGGERVENLFPWSPSWGEINYFTYANPTIEFHNELYGRLQSLAIDEDVKYEKERDFDQWLSDHRITVSKQWKRIKQGQVQQPYSCTLQTYIRNTIHHPENKENEMYTETEFKESIEGMVSLLKASEDVQNNPD